MCHFPLAPLRENGRCLSAGWFRVASLREQEHHGADDLWLVAEFECLSGGRGRSTTPHFRVVNGVSEEDSIPLFLSDVQDQPGEASHSIL